MPMAADTPAEGLGGSGALPAAPQCHLGPCSVSVGTGGPGAGSSKPIRFAHLVSPR